MKKEDKPSMVTLISFFIFLVLGNIVGLLIGAQIGFISLK